MCITTDSNNGYIRIVNASENNLKNISLLIPKGKITVFTGVSGSGKSSLCIDTIAAESRRELNETFPSFVQQYLPKYGRPKVDRIENMPVTIIIDQRKPAGNSRSTVGTYTDIYALLRLLFSRVGNPFVGYSDSFSFNHPSGSCPRCGGLGVVTDLDIHKLVDFDKCLNDVDVIHFPTFTTGAWRWKRYAYSGLFDLNKKIKDYSPEELELFLYSPQMRLKNPPANWPKSAKYEGLYPRMYRSIITTKEGKRQQHVLDKMVCTIECPDCHGSRLNERVRSCRINDKNIADVLDMPVSDALEFVDSVKNPLAADLRHELLKRLQALCDIGVGYLTLGRCTSTLSGGEAQRIKIAKYINSSLSDMAYVLDEPSVGLHPSDIARLKHSLLQLRDHGNTVLIVEHHREIMALADHVIDMGPGAGAMGGNITFEGDFPSLLASDTVTGRMLRQNTSAMATPRSPMGWYHVSDVCFHNLKSVSVDIPKGVLSVVAGVAGSGKSSLMEVFVNRCDPNAVFIGQKNIGINLRSTPATYLGISDAIRHLFAHGHDAADGVANPGIQLFSFNGKGACPSCKGKGVIVSDMAFMESVETVCEVCHGSRYNPEALSFHYKGKTIAEVMDLSVDEAVQFFYNQPFVVRLLSLSKVGLGYLHLNQSMSTLSGGELQRVKLADNLYDALFLEQSALKVARGSEKNDVKANFRLVSGRCFVIDEPTDGLHFDDVRRLLLLFQQLVDAGNTLILIEHNLDVIRQSDYVVELGPEGGQRGGEIVFQGTPSQMLSCSTSVTRRFLS